MGLHDYARKRRFDKTPEPAGKPGTETRHRPIFVVQLHHARARHYDFRLEMDGVLKSWAVPKGPSLRVGEKRLAVEVEDHPLDYAHFQGDIPEGHYGAGHVDIFDQGHWACDGDPLEHWASGKLDFTLSGEKLQGGWKLVRTSMRGKQKQWLLIKRDDVHAADREADELLDTPRTPATGKRPAGKVAVQAKAGKAGTGEGRATKATPVKAAPAKPAPSKTNRKKTARKPSLVWRKRALALEDARDGGMPLEFVPELATLRAAPPAGDDWLHELKWDGYRLMVDLVDGVAHLRSRGGLDWNDSFPEVARAVEALPVADACLDGELVVLNPDGHSDFSELQRVIDGTSKAQLRYLVFDLPGLAGVDLRHAPLAARKALLQQLLGRAMGLLAFSDHVVGHGAEVFAQTGKQGIEGVVSKRADSAYRAGRGGDWVKAKHENTDEFIIVGYTAAKGSRSGFGSLLLATHADGRLRYVGRVGTGFDDETLRTLHKRLQAIERQQATVELPAHVPFSTRSVHWVPPALVAEVAFRGWAKEGLLRQAAYKRLREDKRASEIAGQSGLNTGEHPQEGEVKMTHPERVVFEGSHYTKGDVADYYRSVAQWLLPELIDRPLSLLRCPEGTKGECFFQKHHADSLGAHVHAVALAQKSGREQYLYVDSIQGVLALVQMNTLELHPWGAHVAAPEQPDRLVFDLDPGPGVRWPAVIAAARDVRDKLKQAGLQSFVRLSGGKGLHVVVPISPAPSWDEARSFCKAFAEALTAHAPQTYVATMTKTRRDGKIFIDWLRNARGATSVASWSLRARKGAPVAVPLRWEDLGRIKRPDAYDLDKARRRAASLGEDPWGDFQALKQVLPH